MDCSLPPPPHCSTVRAKVYAVLELWVQVCGASAGVLQGGASGEALLSHLLSDISPPADTLKVSEGPAPGPGLLSGTLAGVSLPARRCLLLPSCLLVGPGPAT